MHCDLPKLLTLTRERKNFRRNKGKVVSRFPEEGIEEKQQVRVGRGGLEDNHQITPQCELKTTLPICMIRRMSLWSFHLSEGLQGHSWCCHNASQYYEEISCTDPLWSPLTWGTLNAKFSWWLAGKHLKKASFIILLPDPLPVGSPLPLSSLISCHGCSSLSKWHFSQYLPSHHPQRGVWVSKENSGGISSFYDGLYSDFYFTVHSSAHMTSMSLFGDSWENSNS